MLNLFSDMNLNKINGSNGLKTKNEDPDIIDKETLIQYISFARQEIQPKLSLKASEKLV